MIETYNKGHQEKRSLLGEIGWYVGVFRKFYSNVNIE